jgi:iron-sulfur cluster assembly protein
MNVTITPSAEKFIQRMIRFNSQAAGSGFRLTVSAGGCSGLASEFTVESEPLAGDVVVEHNGMKLFLPAESRLLLDGATIDFSDSLMASGLTITSPASSSCGCSSSSSTSAGGIATVSLSDIGHKH